MMDEATKAMIESGRPFMQFNIQSVGQLNPNATSVTNHYWGDQFVPKDIMGEGKEVGFVLDPSLPAWLREAPGKVFNQFSNGAVSNAIYEAGITCGGEPWMLACLMAVCDDHGCLVDRSDKAGFARAMFAMKLASADEGETTEEAVAKLANSMNRTINSLDLGYLDIEETTAMKSKKQKCINLGQYFENHSVPYRRKRK